MGVFGFENGGEGDGGERCEVYGDITQMLLRDFLVDLDRSSLDSYPYIYRAFPWLLLLSFVILVHFSVFEVFVLSWPAPLPSLNYSFSKYRRLFNMRFATASLVLAYVAAVSVHALPATGVNGVAVRSVELAGGLVTRVGMAGSLEARVPKKKKAAAARRDMDDEEDDDDEDDDDEVNMEAQIQTRVAK